MYTPPRGVLFDVDGTLVDSNDANAHAWVDAMEMEGHRVAFDRVRPLIGMGADKVLPQVLGIAKETEEGKRISQHRKEIYLQHYLPQIKAFPRALELLERMQGQGLTLIIATTAEPEELQGVLPLLGPHASTLFTNAATAKDAVQSKPDGDVVQAAVERSGSRPDELVMIGDTPYDIAAAAKVGVQTIAFRSGGWSEEDLTKAIAVYDNPADLLAHYETSVFVTGKETRNDHT
ncbi:MAG TPA: HAD family hydrolase [Ktedonobacteraceae bacterium]